MKQYIPVTNTSAELACCADAWFFDENYNCWCLEDLLYTQKAATPKFQRLSVYVPAEYMSEGGAVNEGGVSGRFTAKTAPVVFMNQSAGYMQMPHSWLGGPRDEGPVYLKRGMVYVTCGLRGRDSKDAEGQLCAKSPWSLIDLKTAIRFLRHNKNVLPGDFDRIISVGWSAGGAMSSLLGITGNCPDYDSFLKENGAFMDETDDVYAAMVYCPIIDLDHADLAYEWQFVNDTDYEANMTGPAGTLTEFETALSRKLAARYVDYFNSLGLKLPGSGRILSLGKDGRSGSGYDYIMALLEEAADEYLTRLDEGRLEENFGSADYISGDYTFKKEIMELPEGSDDPGLHHAGAPVALPQNEDGRKPPAMPSLGDLMSRPPKGTPVKMPEFKFTDVKGDDKRGWLSWDGRQTEISGLDDYILGHRRRMKPCTSFDTLNMDSGENQEFGTPQNDYMHFNTDIAAAIEELKDEFPEEYAQYYPSFAAALGDEELEKRKKLINPMNYIGSLQCDASPYFRIRVGAQDADTSFAVSMALALKLAETGADTDYALVWDKPHCMADYPGEFCDWIEEIV